MLPVIGNTKLGLVNVKVPELATGTFRLTVISIVMLLPCRILLNGLTFTPVTSVARIVRAALATGRVPT